MEIIVWERHQINVFDAIKPLHISEILKHIKEVILERNLVNILNVVKLLQVTVSLKAGKSHTCKTLHECNKCSKTFHNTHFSH